MHKTKYEQLEDSQRFHRVLAVFMALTIAILVYSINAMEQKCTDLEEKLSLANAKNDTLKKLEKQVAMGLCLPLLEERR